MATNSTISISSGASLQKPIWFKNADGSAFDLASVSAMKLRVKNDLSDIDADALIEKAVNLADPDHDKPAGKIVLKLTSSETKIAAGKYQWDLRCEQPAGTLVFYAPTPPAIFIIMAVVNIDA